MPLLNARHARVCGRGYRRAAWGGTGRLTSSICSGVPALEKVIKSVLMSRDTRLGRGHASWRPPSVRVVLFLGSECRPAALVRIRKVSLLLKEH